MWWHLFDETPCTVTRDLSLPSYITNAGTGQRQVTSITSNQSGQTSVNSWDKYKFAYIHNYFLPFLSPNADSGPSSQIHLVFIPVHWFLCPPDFIIYFPWPHLTVFFHFHLNKFSHLEGGRGGAKKNPSSIPPTTYCFLLLFLV